VEEDRLLIEQLKQGALPPGAPPSTAAAAAAAAVAQEPRRAMQPEGLLESLGASLFSNLARAGHGAVGGADSTRALNDTPAVLLSRGAARGGRTLEGDERAGPVSFVTSDAVLAGGARPPRPAGWSPALADPLLSRPAAAAPDVKAEAAARAPPQPPPQPQPQPQPHSNATPAQVPAPRPHPARRALLPLARGRSASDGSWRGGAQFARDLATRLEGLRGLQEQGRWSRESGSPRHRTRSTESDLSDSGLAHL
jgi:hypothetical protein